MSAHANNYQGGSPADLQAQQQQALSDEHQYSNDSERALCAGIMRAAAAAADPALHARLFSLLAPEDFYVEQHQAVWSIAQSMHTAGVDISALSIADASARQGSHVGGAPYLAGLLEDPLCRATTSEALMAAAGRIKGLAMLRKLQSSLHQALALCRSNDFAAVASFVEDDLSNLRRAAISSRSGPKQLFKFIETVIARIDAMADGKSQAEGISTGFEELDGLIGGLLPETLTVIAARPAMGKTAFALNIARNVAQLASKPVLIFSLEMTGSALAQRTLAAQGRISMKRLKTADLNDDEWSRLVESVEALKDSPIYIDESPGLTLSNIRARARAFQHEHPTGVIMLDYLQIVSMDKQQKDKIAHVGEVSRGLKELARELQMPVVALAQLSRDLEKRTNKRPMMSDLRESGQIEQDAEVILFLYRDEVYNPDTPDKGITEVIVGKNRDGATGTVRNSFHGELMLFTEQGLMQGQD
jgi:replicative DNA helicase